MSKFGGAIGGVAFLLVPIGIAQATITLGSSDTSISAPSAVVLAKDGTRVSTSWDLATAKAGRSSGGAITGTLPAMGPFIMEKVSLQDFHRLCPGSAPPAAARAGNGKVYDDTAAPLDGVTAGRKADGGIMASDDWEAPVCKLSSATLSEGSSSFTLTDVSIKRSCDGACSSGSPQTDLEVSYARMAINEKGLPGTRKPVKGSAK